MTPLETVRTPPPARPPNGAKSRRDAAPALERLPPSDVDAEQAVLGSMLMSNRATERGLQILEARDFYILGHRITFNVIRDLRSKSVMADTLTVHSELLRVNQAETVGGLPALNALCEAVPTAAHVEYYAARVLETSLLRRIIEGASDLVTRAYAAQDTTEELTTQLKVLEERITGRRERPGPRIYTLAELERTNFPPAEWLIPGLLPLRSVCLIAGAPKVKKSFFGLDVAVAVSLGGIALGRHRVPRHGILGCFTEDLIEDVKVRAARHFAEPGWPENAYITDECPRMDEGGETWLHEFLMDHPDVRFVVLDPLINVRGKGRHGEGSLYSGDYDDLAPFKRLVKLHGVTILLIHHTNKKVSTDPFAIISGTQGILGSVDGAMVLVADESVTTAVVHAKGRRVRPYRNRWAWDDHVGWVDEGPASEDDESAEEQRAIVRVLRNAPSGHLRHGELVAKLMEVTGCKESAAKMRIRRARQEGLITAEAGLYWLRPENGATRSDHVTDVTGAPSTHENGPENGSHGHVTNPGDVTGAEGHKKSHDPLTDCGGDRSHGHPGSHGHVTPDLASKTAKSHMVTSVLAPAAGDPEQALRTQLRLLALERGFPEVTVWGEDCPGGEDNWAHYCRTYAPGWLTAALAALEGSADG
jgi:hypothetical protein